MSDSNLPEEWRPIPGYGGLYEISTLGRIRRPPRTVTIVLPAKTLAPAKNWKGYRIVALQHNGKKHQKLVHRLVLEVFDRPPQKGEETRHLDGSRDNNRLSNLAWGTSKENAADKRRHGTTLRGRSTVLTEEMAHRIAALRVAGMTLRAIAKECRIGLGTVMRGLKWKRPLTEPEAGHNDLRVPDWGH